MESATRIDDLRRGIRLEYLTVGWNVVEGIVAVASGAVAGSIALVGFGVDSFIESSSGGVLLWRLQAERRGAVVEQVEKRALRLVGIGFLFLAAYAAFEAISNLLRHEAPSRSPIGIAIAVLSLVVMPWLAREKRKTSAALGSKALRADSRQTSLCAYLSAILLGGLLLNSIVHWWWADSVAALLMTPIIVREGIEGTRGERCEDCHP